LQQREEKNSSGAWVIEPSFPSFPPIEHPNLTFLPQKKRLSHGENGREMIIHNVRNQELWHTLSSAGHTNSALVLVDLPANVFILFMGFALLRVGGPCRLFLFQSG
jgi:hypothetical protein